MKSWLDCDGIIFSLWNKKVRDISYEFPQDSVANKIKKDSESWGNSSSINQKSGHVVTFFKNDERKGLTWKTVYSRCWVQRMKEMDPAIVFPQSFLIKTQDNEWAVKWLAVCLGASLLGWKIMKEKYGHLPDDWPITGTLLSFLFIFSLRSNIVPFLNSLFWLILDIFSFCFYFQVAEVIFLFSLIFRNHLPLLHFQVFIPTFSQQPENDSPLHGQPSFSFFVVDREESFFACCVAAFKEKKEIGGQGFAIGMRFRNFFILCPKFR